MSADTRQRLTGTGAITSRPSPVRRLLVGRKVWWPFTVPAVVLVALFFVVPFLLNLRFAFTNWTGFAAAIDWNGLDNFIDLAQGGILFQSIGTTLEYALIAMIVQNVFSLSAALALQRTDRVNGFFRSFFFLPVLIAPVAAGYIWSALLSPAGPINQAVAVVVPGFDFAWLGNGTTALATVAFIDAWKWSGLITLVYIAGLNSIPDSLLEAARIDGANAWQRFWRVQFRLLAPAFTFTVVVTLIGAIGAYDIVQATTKGGPGVSTRVLNVAVYGQYGGGFYGSSSALNLVVIVLVVLIALPLIAFLRSREIEA